MFNLDENDFEADSPKLVTLEQLRDIAIKVFDDFMHEQNGTNPAASEASFEEKCEFLSIAETEAIVKDFSSADVGDMFAVGAPTRAEAVAKMRELVGALVNRVMSNVIALGVKQELIDVAFDDEHNNFAFAVSPKGHALVAANKEFFEKQDSGDENADE